MEKIYIFGHQKPDTDSVTSAIALSYLKNQLGYKTEPRILGDINKETEFVLNYFKVKKPKYLDSVKLQIKDVNYYPNCYLNEKESLETTYDYLVKNNITATPIVDDNNKILGIVTVKDMIKKLKKLDFIDTNLDTVIKVLKGECLLKVNEEINGYVTLKNNEVIVKNNDKISLLITNDINYDILRREYNIVYSPIDIVKIISTMVWTNYVKCVVVSGDRIYKFSENTYYDDFIRETSHLNFNNYPVIGINGKCQGLIRITDIAIKHKKKVILVDHNELSQSVDGLEESEIIEIIDHHKIGSLSTSNPISFRNMTVGSTNTIIYQLYQENKVDIPYEIGGMMLSGILSDTIGLTSSTTTDIDREVVSALSSQMNIDYRKYNFEMLKAGTSLEGLTYKEIVKQDLKYFQLDDYRYAISQILTLDIDSILKDKEKYLKIISDQKEDHELKLMIFIITDVLKKGSYLLYSDGSDEMIKEIYNLSDVYQGVFIPGLTSRKKQVVPFVNEYLK